MSSSAYQEYDDDEYEQDASPPEKSNSAMIGVVIGVVVIGIIGAIVWYIMANPKTTTSSASPEEATSTSASAPVAPAPASASAAPKAPVSTSSLAPASTTEVAASQPKPAALADHGKFKGTDAEWKAYSETGYWTMRSMTIDSGASGPFDELKYLRANADVFGARLNGWDHYVRYGKEEGREAWITPPATLDADLKANGMSGTFDKEAYYRLRPDVKAAKIDALTHYQRDGYWEHQDLTLTMGDKHGEFDTLRYYWKHKDIANAKAGALAHYDAFGFAEGRTMYLQ